MEEGEGLVSIGHDSVLAGVITKIGVAIFRFHRDSLGQGWVGKFHARGPTGAFMRTRFL